MAPKRRELVWVATGQALCLAVGFLSVKILTNLMGVAAYGQLMLGISIAALISLFVYGPLGQAAIRFYSVCRERGDLRDYVGAFRTIHTRLLWTMVLLAFAMTLAMHRLVDGVWPYLVAAAVLYSAITGMNHSLLSMFSGMRRRDVVALHQGGESMARLFGALTAMFLVGVSPSAALSGYALGSLLVLVSLVTVARSAAGPLSPEPLKGSAARGTVTGQARTTIYGEIWEYVLPFLAWAAIGYTFIHGDRWMLQGVRGPEAVGAYMAIYQIGSALPNAIISVMSQYLEPLVFERVEASGAGGCMQEATSLIRGAVLYVCIVLIGIATIASVWSTEIIDFIANPEVARHSHILTWIVAGTGTIGLAQILTIPGLAMRRPSAYLSAKAIAAITLLGTAYFGASQRGVEGVAIALVVSGSVYLVCVLVINTRLAVNQSRESEAKGH